MTRCTLRANSMFGANVRAPTELPGQTVDGSGLPPSVGDYAPFNVASVRRKDDMTSLFDMNGPDFLKVRISVSMLQCTYSCEYCVAASGQSQTKGVDCSQGMARPVWGENGRELAQKAISWVASLPYRVGVRYDVHGEPFINDDVLGDIAWLTRQENLAFVEVQTNASMFKKRIPELATMADISRLTLFCTFHHSQISPEKFLENVLCARDQGIRVIVNVLVFHDNVPPVENVLELCREKGIPTSADIRYPGFTVSPAGDGKRARHFLKSDPFKSLLDAGASCEAAFRVVADSGPLGKNLRFLAAMLTGIYGMPGRLCSAGHDYIFVDRWGDVYRCFCYADIDKNKMGSVYDAAFIPRLRENVYAPCRYKETCHQKEEYGNLKILRDYRNREQPSLNCFCAATNEADSLQLYGERMAMLDLAWHSLKHDRKGLFIPG